MLRKKFIIVIQKNKIRVLIRNNIMFILGSVTFLDVTYILYNYNVLVSRVFINNIIISLKYLVWSNTSMLLVITNFLKMSKVQNIGIKFINVPLFLFELAKVYNLNYIFI